MDIVKAYQYRLIEDPTHGFTVLEDDAGWLYLTGQLGDFYGNQNIFSSIEEIELIIGRKAELIKEVDVI